MTDRERVLENLAGGRNCQLVVESYFSPATWKKYRQSLEPLRKRLANDFNVYPASYGDYDAMPPSYRAGEVFRDAWGCVWECHLDGMEGIVTHSPLAEDSAIAGYKPPDPASTQDKVPFDRPAFEKTLSLQVAAGKYNMVGWERFWERVHFLRGFENTMMDLASGEPAIRRIIDIVVEYNLGALDKYLIYPEVDCIMFGDDWGSQTNLMISPEMWREYFYHGYKAMFDKVHAAGKKAYFHTDGYLIGLIPGIIDAGADIVNLQYNPNPLDEVRDICKGNVCVSMDIDRQAVLPSGTPEEVAEHVRHICSFMDVSAGGLWIKADMYPDTPLENIDALCTVLEDLRN